jgi:hypothetical protein
VSLRGLVGVFLRDLVRRRMLWVIVLATLGVLAANYGIQRSMDRAIGEGASWDTATRRASADLERLAAQVRDWLPVTIVLLAAIVAPESRRNGTTQFALSCGVRRSEVAAAQFAALSVILGVVIAIVHLGFAVPGITTGTMSPTEAAAGWVGLLIPLFALAAAVFCLSLTATVIETYLVFLGLPFVMRTIPNIVGGFPSWLPRPVVAAIDNSSLLFPEVEALAPWPHLSYGKDSGLPHADWHWPAAHLSVVILFWLVAGLWRYRRHDFGSRAAVK